MNSTRYTTVLTGFVVLLMVASLVAPVAYADSHQSEQPAEDTDTTYRIVQGDQEFEVEPIEGDVPVEEFYDYRYPYQSRDDPSWGRSFSSQGTTEYQQDSTSILMLYEGPNGVSLVAIHDKYHENRQNGTPGSSVSYEISGLPESGEWAVIDDDYDWRNESTENDDIFQLASDHRAGAAGNDGEPPEGVDARLSWVWTTARNDGMAYRGIGQENVSITIDPAYNGESYHRYGDTRRPDENPDEPEAGPEYNGTIEDWQVISATDSGEDYKRIWFNSLEQEVTITTASQSDSAPAALSGPSQATVGEEVVFNTSATEGIESYQWTVDGTTVESATGPELAHTFEEAGTAEVELTVTTADGQTATESATVEVVEGEGTTGGEQTLGFGPVVAVIALIAVLLVAVRRRTA